MADQQVLEALNKIKNKGKDFSKSQFTALTNINDAIEEAVVLYEEYGENSMAHFEKSLSATEDLNDSVKDLVSYTKNLPALISSNIPAINYDELKEALTPEVMPRENKNSQLDEILNLMTSNHNEILSYMDGFTQYFENTGGISAQFLKQQEETDQALVESQNIIPTKLAELPAQIAGLLPPPMSEPELIPETQEEEQETQKKQTDILHGIFKVLNDSYQYTKDQSKSLLAKAKNSSLPFIGDKQKEIGKLSDDIKLAGAGALASFAIGTFDTIGKTGEILGKSEADVSNFEHAFVSISSGFSNLANMFGADTSAKQVYDNIFGENGFINGFLKYFGADNWQNITKSLDEVISQGFDKLFTFIFESVPKFMSGIVENPIKTVGDSIKGLFGFGGDEEAKPVSKEAIETTANLLKGSNLTPASMSTLDDGVQLTKKSEESKMSVQQPTVVNNVVNNQTMQSTENKRSVTDLDLQLTLMSR